MADENASGAAKYALEEIAARRALYPDSPLKLEVLKGLGIIVERIGNGSSSDVLTAAVDELLATLIDAEAAALARVTCAQEAMAAIARKFERHLTVKVAPSISLSDITAERARRSEERARALDAQSGLEDELDAMRERLQQLAYAIDLGQADENAPAQRTELKRRIEAQEASIAAIVESVTQNDREVAEITRYEAAVRLVTKGLPEGLVRKTSATATNNGNK